MYINLSKVTPNSQELKKMGAMGKVAKKNLFDELEFLML